MEHDQGSTYVFVQLGGKRYGFPAESVREVYQMVEPTPVPSWPEEVLGVMDVRGSLVPMVDVAGVLGQPVLKLSKNLFILVVSALGREWGILVEQVDGVRMATIQTKKELAQKRIVDVPAVCLGIALDPEGPIVMLDPEAVLRPIHSATERALR